MRCNEFVSYSVQFDHITKSSCDLVEIMNIGNDMYTVLSRAAQQEYLLLSEIPAAVCIREEMYNLQYSESFYGIIFQNNIMEENNCVPLQLALESLLIKGYQSFLLTITILTVAIFETNNGCFKVFDSHSRNASSMSDPFGTCVLLEVSSVAELVEYFRNLYFGREHALYKVKGVKI